MNSSSKLSEKFTKCHRSPGLELEVKIIEMVKKLVRGKLKLSKFGNIVKNSQIFIYIDKIFSKIHKNSQIFTNIHKYSQQIFTNIKNITNNTNIHKYSEIFINIHKYHKYHVSSSVLSNGSKVTSL